MTDITIEALKLRRRAIEINIAMNQGALEEIDNIIGEMERRRGGRPRKTEHIAIIPQRVGGGTYEPERDEEGELPEGRKRAAEIMAAQGILKENVG